MKRRCIGFLILLSLLLSACSNKDKYEPFKELSRETVSPERQAAVMASLDGDAVLPTRQAAPTDVPAEEPEVLPSFDEDSFFAEVDPVDEAPKVIPTEPAPFEPEPTATPVPPTKVPPTPTPEPTATAKPYDPNIMMYGSMGNGMTTYTLQEGEDLICLGRRFDVSLTQLLGLNKLTAPADAKPGDVIVLPRNPSPWSRLDGYGGRALALHPTVYTTVSGDNLFSIACSFGDVRPEDIAVKNQLVLGEPLEAGLQIVIP